MGNRRGWAGHDADMIDPADSREWIVAGLRSLPPAEPRTGERRPYIDTW